MKTKDIIKKIPDGTYAGIKFAVDTKQAIKKYMKDNKIPNPLNTNKIHSTLLYSRKYLPDYKPAGILTNPWIGKAKQFSIFLADPKNGKDGSNCLVLEYECAEQSARFDELMNEHDATYDFDEYKPHITLSYNVGDLDVKKLPKFEENLEIVEEYVKDLNLNYAESATGDK